MKIVIDIPDNYLERWFMEARARHIVNFDEFLLHAIGEGLKVIFNEEKEN